MLLFRAEMWVLTPRMEWSQSIFRHRVARWLTGRYMRRRGGGSMEYSSLDEAMVESGFERIGTYVTRRQNMVAQYIAM